MSFLTGLSTRSEAEKKGKKSKMEEHVPLPGAHDDVSYMGVCAPTIPADLSLPKSCDMNKAGVGSPV